MVPMVLEWKVTSSPDPDEAFGIGSQSGFARALDGEKRCVGGLGVRLMRRVRNIPYVVSMIGVGMSVVWET